MTPEPSQPISTLKKDSIGLTGVVVQSGADIAPAVAVVTSGVFIATLSGIASPLAFLFGTIIALALAKVIADFAKKMPTSSAFYTFLSRAFGPKTGFVMGALLFLAYLLLLLFQLSFFGQFVNGIIGSDVNIPWWVYAIVMIAFSTFLFAAGVRPSLNTGLIGLFFELTVFLILAILIVVKGGADGLSLQPFNPAQAPSVSGLLLGVIFGIFVFVGFESAATLGEEARDPHRTIPRALYLTVGAIGVFVIFVTYAMVIGFGADAHGIAALQANSTPFDTLAGRYGDGLLRVLVDTATVTSFLALNIVMVIASSRMLYSISRDGLLPKVFSTVNRRKSPSTASIAVGGVSLVIAIVTGLTWGPLNVANWFAFLSTLFFIAAYVTVCVGGPRYYWRENRSEFSWFGNAVVPAVALTGMGAVLYGNLIPFPAAPLDYFPFVTLAIIAILAAIAWRLEKTNPDRVRLAGQLFSSMPVEVESAAEGFSMGSSAHSDDSSVAPTSG